MGAGGVFRRRRKGRILPMPPDGARQKALEALGLSPGAGREEIRRAFRRMAFHCHPDRHPGRPEMERQFKELSAAYRTLMAEPPEEILPPAPAEAPLRGRDLTFRLRLDFLQAARGGRIPVRFTRPALCAACGGREEAGCGACGGRGEVPERALVVVEVPSGAEEGERIRVAGEGGPGRSGGAAGDLLIIVSCGGHPALKRRGLDVYGEVKVPRFRLESGGPVRVFTVRGGARIQIPPGTPPGRVIRLPGWGIRRARRGQTETRDHIVRIAEMPSEAEV